MLGLATYTPSEVDALFAAFDPDGSGEITFRELCAHRVPSSLSLSLSPHASALLLPPTNLLWSCCLVGSNPLAPLTHAMPPFGTMHHAQV